MTNDGPRNPSCRALIVLSMLGLLTLPSAASAQRKPLPPREPEARRGFSVSNEFLEAYARAGNPRILIYSYLMNAPAGARDNLEQGGIAPQFNTRLMQYLRHRDVRMKSFPFDTQFLGDVFGAETEAHAGRKGDLLNTSLKLGKRADVDIVILVLFTQAERDHYRSSYAIIDVNRRESIGTWSWDTVPGSDGRMGAERLGAYAERLAERIQDDFVLHYIESADPRVVPKDLPRALQRFNVEIVGAEGGDTVRAREVFENIPGVERATGRSHQRTPAGRTRTVIEIEYRGEPFDLAATAQTGLERALGSRVNFRETTDGSIRFEVLGGDRAAGAESDGTEFDRAYERAGKPSVAVLVNRRASAGDIDNARVSAGVQVTVSPEINVSGSGDAKSGGTQEDASATARGDKGKTVAGRLTDDDLMDTALMETLITERLLERSVKVKDPAFARRTVVLEASDQRKMWDQKELALRVGRAAGVDLVIDGYGQVVRTDATRGEDEGDLKLVYAFTAFSTETGDVFAASSVVTKFAQRNRASLQTEAADAIVERVLAAMAQRWSDLP